MKAHGHEVVVLLPDEGPLVDKIRSMAIPVHVMDLAILRRRYFTPWGLMNRAYNLLLCFFRIRAIVKKERIDLIYSNTFGVIVGAVAARLVGIRHIFHVHEILNPPWLNRILCQIANRSSQAVIVVSEAVRAHLKPNISKVPISRIYNGLPYEPFLNVTSDIRKEMGYTSQVLVVGLIGRIHFWKGQDYFLEICKELKRLKVKAKYVIVGDVFPGYEHLEQKLRDMIEELDLTEDVKLLGFREDVPAVMQALDVFVSSSVLPDPLPTVILEAMASGKAVVATAHGGAVEMVIPEKTGVLIPYDDPTLAAEIMLPVLKDTQKRREMGASGRERVLETFSLEAYEQNISELIAQVMSGGK